MKEFEKQGNTLEGKRTFEMERSQNCLYTKFFGALTQVRATCSFGEVF